MLLPVFGSASRQSLVGFLIVLAWYFLRRARPTAFFGGLFAVVALLSIMPIVAPHTYQRSAAVLSMDTLEGMKRVATTSEWEPGEEKTIEGRQHNILERVLYQKYALRRFLQSPFLGIGLGRFNDHDLEMSGIEGLTYFAVGGKKILGGHGQLLAGAHNSYIQLAADVGLLGLGLMLWLWASLYFRLKRAAELFAEDPKIRSFFIACQGLVLFVFVGGMVEHTMAAPALCLPVLTIVGVGLAYHRKALARLRAKEHAA